MKIRVRKEKHPIGLTEKDKDKTIAELKEERDRLLKKTRKKQDEGQLSFFGVVNNPELTED